MTCKHENADHLMPGQWRYVLGVDGEHLPFEIVTVEQFRCLDCGEWLSLGPSNDSPPEVAIEIRATTLAEVYCGDVADFTQTEWAGWNLDEQHSAGEFDLSSPDWQAGYLAFFIDMHHEPGLSSRSVGMFDPETP